MALWYILADLCGVWGLIVLAPLYLFAVLRGDSTGRAFAHVLASSALLGTMMATGLATELATGSADTKPLPLAGGDLLGLDALLLAAQIVLTLRSPWLYPIVIAAAQLLIVFVDAIDAAGLTAQPATALWLGGLAGAIQFAAFCYGLMAHRTRRRRKAMKHKLAVQMGQLS